MNKLENDVGPLSTQNLESSLHQENMEVCVTIAILRRC